MDIRKHISAANKIFEKNHPVASLQSAYIDNGKCTVGTLLIQYEFPVPITGRGCIDWPDLKLVLSAGLSSGEIHILPNEVEGEVILRSDTSVITLPATTGDDYPLIKTNISMTLAHSHVSGYDMAQAIKYVDTYVDKESGPRPLNGVRLEKGHILACDSYVLFTKDASDGLMHFVNITIPPKVVAALPAVPVISLRTEKEDEKGDILHGVFSADDMHIVFRSVDGIYPDVSSSVYTPDHYLYLNREMAAAGLGRLAVILKDNPYVTLLIDNVEGTVKMKAESKEPNKKGEIDLGKVVFPRTSHILDVPSVFTLHFNQESLAAALAANPTELRLGWSPNRKSVYINNLLVMPAHKPEDTEAID